MSENWGGKLAIEKESRKEPSVYGKYFEPVFHGAMHVARSGGFTNKAELGRAKDMFAATGTGLHQMVNKFHTSYTAESKKKEEKK